MRVGLKTGEFEYEPLEQFIDTTEELFQLHDMSLLYQDIGYFEEVVISHLKSDFDSLVPDEMKKVARNMPKIDVDILGEIYLRENMRTTRMQDAGKSFTAMCKLDAEKAELD